MAVFLTLSSMINALFINQYFKQTTCYPSGLLSLVYSKYHTHGEVLETSPLQLREG